MDLWEFDKLKIDAQRLDKTSFASAESLKLILDHNAKNARPTAMPIDTSKNR
jgi:hypothetical protein